MPSHDATQKSSTGLKPSLRSFRLKAQPAASSTQSNSNSISQPIRGLLNSTHINPTASTSYSASSSTPTSSAVATNSLLLDSKSFIQQITKKISGVIANDSPNNLLLDLKLTPEEIAQLKREISRFPNVSHNWKNHVVEDASKTISSTLQNVKINRQYLNELLNSFEDNRNKLDSSEQSESGYYTTNIQKSIKTYEKNASPKTLNLNPVNIVADQSSSDNTGGQKQLIMEDFDSFCEKEQSLRQLLDLFPDADIMEAQDLLVESRWNVRKAIELAKQRPLRMTRKRSASSTLLPNQQVAQGNVYTYSNTQRSYPATMVQKPHDQSAEEIVLSSDDDDDNSKINGNIASVSSISQEPPHKRSRHIVSDSESEEDSPLLNYPTPAPKSSSSKAVTNDLQVQKQNKNLTVTQTNVLRGEIKIKNDNPQTPKSSLQPIPQQSKNLMVTQTNVLRSEIKMKNENPVTPTPKSNNAPPVPTPKSNNAPPPAAEKATLSIIPTSAPSAKFDLSSIPNLPKGLVITQISSSGSSSNSTQVSPGVQVKETSTSKSESPNQGSSSSISASSSSISSSSSASSTPKRVPPNLVRLKSSSLSVEPVNGPAVVKSASASMQIIPSSSSVSITPTTAAQNETATVPIASKGKPKAKRKKFYEDDDDDDDNYGNDDIYDSEESDSETPRHLTAAHYAVLKFFQEATIEELASIQGCTKKKADAIISIRPFPGWNNLVSKLKNDKVLSTDMLNGAKKVIDMRNAIGRLMSKCQQISQDMEILVENLKSNKESSSEYVNQQPSLLNQNMHLASYQMLGLNWLMLMHNQEVNAILADEMGLGKTVQAIAFLAYLKEIEIYGPHLIIVPSSTLDNWKKELHLWWPNVSIICYHGSQDSRKELRMKILSDEFEDFDVMVTTYNMVASNAEDRSFFKRLEFHYVIFDEAHMLKNMSSQRYQNLMRIRAPRRLLLTGTPLQNNLVELMSLLIFAMPHMFSGKIEQVKQMFSCVGKTDESRCSFERERIEHAKGIMRPFVLRRLKREVLKDLPAKHEETKFCPMSEDQADKYEKLVEKLSQEVESNKEKDITTSGAGMMMQLRRAANHPLLLRHHYKDGKLLKMARAMLKEPSHSNADPNLIFEDMCVMSDFELHKLCKLYKAIGSHKLANSIILDSGKFAVLDSLLPALFEQCHRILLFSQFTMVLDIIQEYMDIKKYKYLRMDGSVPVVERQQLIDEFNSTPDIAVFLLSTRAGGLGINLTAADTVILHDIDFNPYNDKQAEDRCHRVGQDKDVKVIRMVSEDTIEEGILQRANEKLRLEKDIHENDTEENDVASVAQLLREALGLKVTKHVAEKSRDQDGKEK